jgi:hypothetical protein
MAKGDIFFFTIFYKMSTGIHAKENRLIKTVRILCPQGDFAGAVDLAKSHNGISCHSSWQNIN